MGKVKSLQEVLHENHIKEYNKILEAEKKQQKKKNIEETIGLALVVMPWGFLFVLAFYLYQI